MNADDARNGTAEVRARAEAQAARRQLAFLANATPLLLASSLDSQSTFTNIIRLAVPSIADWCALYLTAGDGTITAVVVAPDDGAPLAESRTLQDRTRPDPQLPRGVARVVRTGRPELYPELSDIRLVAAAGDEERLSSLRELGVASAMIIPLRVRDQTIGAIALVSSESRHRYDLSDLMMAQELVYRAALAVDNAYLYEAERAARRTAERSADLIARVQAVTAGLAEALTAEQVAQVVVDDGITALGAKAAMMALVTEDGTALGTIRAVGFLDDVAGAFRRLPLSSPMPIAVAARTGVPAFISSCTAMLERFPVLRGTAVGLPAGAAAILPLRAGSRTIGSLMFLFAGPWDFGDDDKAFILTLARLAAQALERSWMYEREHRVAETLQRALLPATLPQIPGVALHAAYRPGSQESEVGGDWYDAFGLADGTIALSVGDVTGRGLHAAVTMGQIRQSIRTAAMIAHDPAEVLEQASSALRCEDAPGMATALFGVFDPISLTFTYASAGHPAPVVGMPDARVELLTISGLPLGVQRGVRRASTVKLLPGTLLVLYTDGVVEARRNIVEGEAALVAAVGAEVLASSQDPANSVLERVLDGVRPVDDVAVLALSIAPVPLDRFDLVLPATPAAARRVRQAFRRVAIASGARQDRLELITVALGEAVNNIVEHAYGASQGTVHATAQVDGQTLVLQIEDSGKWRPERAEKRGHGLRLMKMLVDTVEVDTGPSGTIVRLRADLSGGAEEPKPLCERHAPSSIVDTDPGLYAAGRDRHIGEVPETSSRVVGAPCRIRTAAGIPVVEVFGDVDMANAGGLDAAVTSVAERAQGIVVVSLGPVSYLDSQGVKVLLNLAERLAHNRKRLAIVTPPAQPTRRILEITGASALCSLYDAVEDAVAAHAAGTAE